MTNELQDNATPGPRPGKHRASGSVKRILLVAAIAVLASIGFEAATTLKPYIADPVRDVSRDVDWYYINMGLERVSSFADTASWWTGSWRQGVSSFWRPLSSYVFWGMRLVWPAEYMLPRQAVLLFLHLCFVAMGGLLLWRLTGRPRLVLLTLWLFAGLRPYPMRGLFGHIASVQNVLLDPKNIPDPLAGIAMLASLLLLANGKWAVGLVAAVISVGFKEVGFATWPLALIVLPWVHRDRIMAAGGTKYVTASIRRNWLPVAAWLLALALLLAIHLFAVGAGSTFHLSEISWQRAALYFGGPIAVKLLLGEPSPVILALLVVGAVLALRRLSLLPRLIGVLLALAVGIALDTRLQGTPWDVSMVTLLTFGLELATVLACIIWLLVAWEARHDWQTVALGAAMCLVASMPTWASARALEHSRYAASFFMEIVVAAALAQAARTAVKSRRSIPQKHGRNFAAHESAAAD